MLKGIESGDPAAVKIISPDQYIQHNPQTHEGREGLAALFKRLAKTSPRVNIVRIFSDGDFVFAHTEYDFSTSRVGFEVFRFQGEYAVEHWDNIQPRVGPNPGGHTMVDGETTVLDLDLTESNRKFVKSFVQDVLIDKDQNRIADYIDSRMYVEHDPLAGDSFDVLSNTFLDQTQYLKCHRILSEGNFVLCVCEGKLDGKHTSFYDLFRVEQGRIVEHWDTREFVPDRSEWKNENGKF